MILRRRARRRGAALRPLQALLADAARGDLRQRPGGLGLLACLAVAGATWRGVPVAPRPALARSSTV